VPDRKMTSDEWDDYIAGDDPNSLGNTTPTVFERIRVERIRDDPTCPMCDEPIHGDAARNPLYTPEGPRLVHWQCVLREVVGGIGHLIAHDHWCGAPRHDPDAGLTYRQSALLTAAWVEAVGVRDEPVVDREAMDGTRLNTAADKINELADQVDTFTDTAGDKATDVANQMRSTAEDLRTMASSLGEGGAGGGTEGGTTPTA
jgi:hypothetical protein